MAGTIFRRMINSYVPSPLSALHIRDSTAHVRQITLSCLAASETICRDWVRETFDDGGCASKYRQPTFTFSIVKVTTLVVPPPPPAWASPRVLETSVVSYK